MLRKIAVLVTFFALALGLSACRFGPVTEGEVTDKIFTEAHTEQQEIMEEECEWDTDTYYSGGKKKTKKSWECENVGTGEYEDVEIPAKWEFELTAEDDATGTVEVDEDTYNNTEIGDWYKS